jgi:3-phosphoshikimate 1-carboxyvinyltransferase
MEQLHLSPISKVDGTVNVPGSKSLSNRALLLAALAKG